MQKRAHDEEEVGHEADGVDAKGEGGDVVSSCLGGQPVGLPGIEEVAEKDGDGRGRQDAGDHDLHGNAADRRNEGKNEEELEEIIDEKADEAVQIPSNEPTGFHGKSLSLSLSLRERKLACGQRSG